MALNQSVFEQVLAEVKQSHGTRKNLIKKLEKEIQRPVISLFTSFSHPVVLDDEDANIFETLLQTMDLKNGFALLLNSPGGKGLAAERIIQLGRKYSKTGEYWVIIPGRAKSAATMVSLGASKIYMGPASELGPVDPQLTVSEDGQAKRFSLCNLVKSYEDLFNKAILEKGNLQPYLQQLQRYDARAIQDFRDAISLSEDIAVQALHNGMMSGASVSDIKAKIKVFLTPEETKSHGRLIDGDKAISCGLNVELIDLESNLWKYSYELYSRLNMLVSNHVAKCIETSQHSFTVNIK